MRLDGISFLATPNTGLPCMSNHYPEIGRLASRGGNSEDDSSGGDGRIGIQLKQGRGTEKRPTRACSFPWSYEGRLLEGEGK